MLAEVAGSSWGSVCLPAGRVHCASDGSGCGSAPEVAVVGIFELLSHSEPTQMTVRALRMPQAKNEFPNANIENVTEC